MLKKGLEYLTNLCYPLFRIVESKVGIMERKYSALDIAKWFLWKNRVEQIENEDEYDDKYEVYEGLSHLKLQKLLYFAQGVNLVVNGKALFSDKIVAWTHGPVVRKIYDTFKGFGRDDINIELTEQDNKIIENIELDSDTSYVLNLVYNNFCIYTAWQLREMTHIPKGPWETTVREKGMDKEIDLSIIKDYFDKNIVTNE